MTEWIMATVVLIFIMKKTLQKLRVTSRFYGKDIPEVHERLQSYVGEMEKQGWELNYSEIKAVKDIDDEEEE